MEATSAHRELPLSRPAYLFWKLLLAVALLGAAVVGVLTWVFSRGYEASLRSEVDARLRAATVAVGELVGPQWPERPDAAIQDQVQATGRRLGTRISLIDAQGRVLADSSRAGVAAVEKMENHRGRPEIIEALRNGAGQASRISPTLGERMRYQATRVEKADGTAAGVVRAGLPADAVAAQIAGMRRWVLAVGALAAAAAVVTAYGIVRYLTAPLRSLAGAAEAILAGRYDQRVPAPQQAGSEIAVVARALDEVRNRLARGERQLQSTSQTQATVLEGMTESVIAVDRNERILFANAAAGRSLGFHPSRVEGLALIEAVRSHELRAAVLQALHDRQPHNCELMWGASGRRRTFDVLAAPLPGEPPPGIVLVLRDITELKRLEQMRQQFIANVSHELKTPLSSIKAYTETLLGGARNDPEHCERFLTRIDEQATRLHELIRDMLSLARIEAGQAELELTDVPLARVVRRCLADYEPQAAAGKVVLENEVSDPELKVRADEEGLRQILNNLVDNAVKYTPAGGRVSVRCRTDGTMAVIGVSDTGVGLAPEHRSRIFERFYRVDRARSRELGGTGLGLSIVKHLCLAMGGRVSVDSQLHKGSTFEVRLPLARANASSAVADDVARDGADRP